MTCVGSSVAVSATIVDAPLFTLQAVRYALAALLLALLGRATGRRLPRPRGREWAWLCGVALTGLVLFNVGVVRGTAHAEPAVIGVAVAAVPLVLALAGPLVSGARPAVGVITGAAVVSVGAALVSGGGRTDLAGLGWAAVVLAGEVAFTLLAVPVLGRLGPWAVALHTVWLAAVMLAVLGVVVEGAGAVRTLDTGDLLAAAHLAVVVTAVAFVLWYTRRHPARRGPGGAVHRRGPGDGRGRRGAARCAGPGSRGVGGHGARRGRAGRRPVRASRHLCRRESAPRAVNVPTRAGERADSRSGWVGVSPGAGSPTTAGARTSP